MPSLTLPEPRRGSLRAFWIVVSCGTGAAVGGIGALTRRDGRLLGLGIPVAAAMAVPGLVRPESTRLAYRVWNRLGRDGARIVTDGATAAAFGVMLSGRGIGDRAELPDRSPGTSGWVPRSSQPALAYRREDAHVDTFGADAVGGGASGAGASGVDAFDRFARRPGNAWAEALRPFVRLLAAVESDRDIDPHERPPEHVYTLY